LLKIERPGRHFDASVGLSKGLPPLTRALGRILRLRLFAAHMQLLPLITNNTGCVSQLFHNYSTVHSIIQVVQCNIACNYATNNTICIAPRNTSTACSISATISQSSSALERIFHSPTPQDSMIAPPIGAVPSTSYHSVSTCVRLVRHELVM
jgi:hypothetical protein